MLHPTTTAHDATAALRAPFAAALIAGLALVFGRPAGAEDRDVEWPSYGGDTANARYSPLDQVHPGNFRDLRVTWRWESPDNAIVKDHPEIRTWKYEGTPILVGGVLYASTSLSQVAAIDARTGRTLWAFDPKTYATGVPANHGYVHRGVARWGDRIFIGTGDAFLYALDARTGAPIAGFGREGRTDLTEGLGRPVDRKFYAVTSPPLVCRDTVIVGSSILDYPAVAAMPPGDVRGFDARTGATRWTFHTIPRKGEFGADTWEEGASERVGNANVWAVIERRPGGSATPTCPSAPPATTTTAAAVAATTCSPTAWSASPRRRGKGSGTRSSSTTGSGITTLPRPRTSSTSCTTAAASAPWRR